MDAYVIRRFELQHSGGFPSFCFLTLPKVDEDHVHARFKQMRVERQRLIERGLCLLVIARFAKTLHHAISVGTAQTTMRQRKRWVERDGAFKMIDGFVDVFARDRVIDVTAQTIATA